MEHTAIKMIWSEYRGFFMKAPHFQQTIPQRLALIKVKIHPTPTNVTIPQPWTAEENQVFSVTPRCITPKDFSRVICS